MLIFAAINSAFVNLCSDRDFAIIFNITRERYICCLWSIIFLGSFYDPLPTEIHSTGVGTLIVATIYLQLIQKRYMFRSFTVPQCSHQHCVQPVASDVEVVGYL